MLFSEEALERLWALVSSDLGEKLEPLLEEASQHFQGRPVPDPSSWDFEVLDDEW